MEGKQDIQSKIEEDIESRKDLYRILLDIIENEDESKNFEFINKLTKYKERENNEDKITIFQIILSICNNHQRDVNFKSKINNLFKYLTNTLKQTMTNSEIFEFFKSNKLIILYFIKNQIIEIDDLISKEIIKDKAYCQFFYTETASFMKEEEKEEIRKEMLANDSNIFEEFEEKRKEG